MAGDIPFAKIVGASAWITTINSFHALDELPKGTVGSDGEVHIRVMKTDDSDVAMICEEGVLLSEKRGKLGGVFILESKGNEEGSTGIGLF